MILSTLLSAKAAAAVVSAGVLVVGGGAAAYAGVLPSALQTVAHDVAGAPAATHGDDDSTESPEPTESASTEAPKTSATAGTAESPDPSMSPSAHGPDATGPAAFGLCTAHSHGGLPDHSTAGKALIAAAGTGSVDDYCKGVLNPSATATTAPTESPSTASAAPTTSSTVTHGNGKAHKHATKTKHGRPASVPSH